LKIVDLHIHSSFSDGLLDPEKIIDIVVDKNLGGFSLTDHDCFEGVLKSIDIIKKRKLSILFIAGCEFSTYLSNPGEIHVLGYFPGFSFLRMSSLISEYIKSRIKRAYRITDCLKKYHIFINLDSLLKNSNTPIGRMHIAREMTRLGYTSSTREAFDIYLGMDCPCYIPRKEINTYEVISSIKENNGLAVIAHPFFLTSRYNWKYIYQFISSGLDGIEFSHPRIPASLSMKIQGTFSKELIMTAGSDFHGDEKTEKIGSYGIDLESAERYFQGFGVFNERG